MCLPPLAGDLRPNCSLIDMPLFWEDQTVIRDVEAHIKALLNHVNVYTTLPTKKIPRFSAGTS